MHQKKRSIFSHLSEYSAHAWMLTCSVFGGGKADYVKFWSDPVRIFLVTNLLIGCWLWMFYRAFLAAEFSMRTLKLPFNDWDGLFASDYR